jgi:hypothetical protein
MFSEVKLSGRRILLVSLVMLLAIGSSTPTAIFSAGTSQEVFTGTWQGPDADDGSSITVSLTQTGNQLQGAYSDTYSKRPDGSLIQPGFSGPGTGSVLSTVEAQMTFDLTRSDGVNLKVAVGLKFSNQNNTLTVSYLTVNGSPVSLQPSVLQRQSPNLPAQRQSYNIGAWYYTGWHSEDSFLINNTERTYGRRDHALGANPWGIHTDYSHREPLLGFYDLLDQKIMDAHIRQAASTGLSFFAFYWYWDADINQEHYVSKPLRTFLSSSLKQHLKFLLAPIKLGDTRMTLEMWANSVVPFMVEHYISDPSYLTTEDGRPIVILFDLLANVALRIRQIGLHPFACFGRALSSEPVRTR